MTDTVWKNDDTFIADSRGASVEFGVIDDKCWVSVDTASNKEVFVMSKEQFEAFKDWVKTA